MRIGKTIITEKSVSLNIALKPYKDNENGEYCNDYCPNCHRLLFPNDTRCDRCNQLLDWNNV